MYLGVTWDAEIHRPGGGRRGGWGQTSRWAGPEAVTVKETGAVKPSSSKAVAMAVVTASASDALTMAMHEPPKPPPVIRAPRAPWSRAFAVATSSSSHDTS